MIHVSSPLICATLSFGLLGAAKGLDEGLIATTVNLPSFIREYGLQSGSVGSSTAANRLSMIVSSVHLGSLPGSWIAYLSSDRIGPVWTMRQLCVLWILGATIVITSAGSSDRLIAGRFVMGMGIGQASIVGPTYLAEVASARHRGLLVGLFSASEYIGIVLGYFAGYGASIHQSDRSRQQWILPQSSHIILAGLLLLVSLGCVDSPRHLCKVQRPAQAAHALGRLRKTPSCDPGIIYEIQMMQDHAAIIQIGQQQTGFLLPWKALFGQASNRSRMLFLLSAQLLSQWSGTNAITTYAPRFFALLGISGNSEELLTTGIFGIVKLVAALVCSIFFIDRIGRKRTLVSGIAIQSIALLYISIYLTVASTEESATVSGDLHRASIVAIICVYVTGIGYAFGWNCVQYILNAEILPSTVRTLGTSILMCIHYANRFALTKSVPSMMLDDALHPKGTFWFFTTVALLGLLWAVTLLPETANRQLEESSEALA
ncbi:general substrate transporter [Aspergillus carlsbadensis]|nr:general substrate transporter [Aspergillus carlsbadensis]